MHRVIIAGVATLLLVVAGGGSMDQERPTRVVSLHYPCAALKARIQGAVRLQCAIGKDGLCSDVKPLVGHPLLLRGAIDNLKKWRYSPDPKPLQKARSAVVEYRFVVSAAPKSGYDVDVVVTFDSPNTVTVVAPFDDRLPCQYDLDERPIG